MECFGENTENLCVICGVSARQIDRKGVSINKYSRYCDAHKERKYVSKYFRYRIPTENEHYSIKSLCQGCHCEFFSAKQANHKGRLYCQKCRVKNKNGYYLERKDENFCISCRGPKEESSLLCRKCNIKGNTNIKLRRIENKKKIIDYLGGKCFDCGLVEEKFTEVYDFHHLNPKLKEISFSKVITYSWKRIEKELNKGLVLLCSNCHRIRHAKENRGKLVVQLNGYNN